MTEHKRWTLTFDDKIVDNKYNITHNVHSGYDVALSFMNILNNYEDKCNVLKDQNEQLKKENKQLKSEIRYIQSKLHNNTMEVRELTLEEIKESIRKLERYE